MNNEVVSVTPTASLTAYAAGDQFGGVQNLSQLLAQMDDDKGILNSLSVIDKESSNSAFDLLFFRSSPSVVSSDNAALDISDAEMASKFLGSLSVASGDYISLVNNSIANINGSEIVLESDIEKGDIFMVAMIQSAPTFTLTDPITFVVGAVEVS